MGFHLKPTIRIETVGGENSCSVVVVVVVNGAKGRRGSRPADPLLPAYFGECAATLRVENDGERAACTLMSDEWN